MSTDSDRNELWMPVMGTRGTFGIVLTEENKQAKPVSILPTDPAERKKIPMTTGVLDYFSAALAEVARVSFQGNEQHNPGQPLHWSRGKSNDHADTILRHLVDRGGRDVDGMRHSAKLAWRCLALLQLELEAEGAPRARGARLPEDTK
jgi:hypothetical protein